MDTSTLVKEKWTEILDYLKKEFSITDVSYRTWLLPLSPYDVSGNVITITVDDAKVGKEGLEFVKNKYGLFLKTAIEEVLSTKEEYELHFTLLSAAQIKTESASSAKSQKNESYETLNQKYTFDTFVVGKSNQFAHAASLAVAESPGEIYNPLFIYGGVGLGKTHLMHSIAHFILDQNPDTKIRYVTSENFTNELIDKIRTNKTAEFREKYRKVDVLLIDDIQFIIGKESTQEEFFHTFNTLHESKKQIIISSDKPPKDIVTLEERLRSRFEWGLIVDIGNPDYETRMAILKKKNDLDHMNIDEKILAYFAEHIKSNIRELEGALNKLVALSRLKKHEINMELAQEALKDYITADTHKKVTLEYIVDVVGEHFNITASDIYSNKKSRDLTYPRQIVMYLCCKLTSLSTTDIGKNLGNRDHTTILHGRNKIEKELTTDESLQNTIEVLIKKINPQ